MKRKDADKMQLVYKNGTERNCTEMMKDGKFNPECLKEFIGYATKDMQIRTCSRRNKKEKFVLKILMEDILRVQLPLLFKIEDLNQEKFDKWHEKTCDMVQKKLNEHYCTRKQKDVPYGKAQKLVNMSMKELCMLTYDDRYLPCFDYCHIPVDSNIVAYFKKQKATKEAFKNVVWSNLDKDYYYKLQNAMRQYCKDNAEKIKNDYIDAKKGKEKELVAEDLTIPLTAEVYIFDAIIKK